MVNFSLCFAHVPVSCFPDVLNELERNLQDALCVGRNLLLESRVLPGGGAAEMALAQHLNEKSKSLSGVVQFPYRALAEALEVSHSLPVAALL